MDDTTNTPDQGSAAVNQPPIHEGAVATPPGTPETPQTTGGGIPANYPGFKPGGPAPVFMTAQGWMKDVRDRLSTAADSSEGQDILDKLLNVIETFLFNGQSAKDTFDAGNGLTFDANNPFGTKYEFTISGSATIALKQVTQ